jgi:hypothetical protein
MSSFTTGFTPLMAPKAVLLGAGVRSLAPAKASSTERKAVFAPSTAKWDARYSHPIPHTNEYYLKCCLGGVLSCGLTHLAVTPLDVAKCNMQVSAASWASRWRAYGQRNHLATTHGCAWRACLPVGCL